MSTLVVLDTGVLGMVVHPNASGERLQCKKWFESLLETGMLVYVPEIVDYELRRKLLHLQSTRAITRLDDLKTKIGYAPITTHAILKAAELWATARKAGTPTADEKELDIDVILAAQTALLSNPGDHAIIATTNIGHLALFADARQWKDIVYPMLF